MKQPIAGFTKCRGLSLIEMMVALTIGLILMAGLVTLQVGSKEAYVSTEQRGRLQENMRFGAEAIISSFRLMGYSGCRTDDTQSLPDAALVGADGGGSAPDEITIRHIGVSRLATYTSGNTFTIEHPHRLRVGNTVIVESCSCGVESVAITAIAINAPNAGTDTVTINRVPGATASAVGGRSCSGAAVREYVSRRYHIQNNTLAVNGVEFVADGTDDRVENMQLLFGEDTSGDNLPNTYVTATAVSDWDKVVSVKLALLFATKAFGTELDTATYELLDQTIDPTDDLRQRRVTSVTVQLRNRIQAL